MSRAFERELVQADEAAVSDRESGSFARPKISRQRQSFRGRGYQTRFTPYWAKTGSAVTTASSPSIAWATSSRSKGSRW